MPPLYANTDAPSPAARPLQPPPTLGRVGQWDLIELAGEGSLTQVYRAQPTGSDADRPAAYALKTLRPAWQEDPRAVALLRREAFVGRRVSHPHLVAVLAASIQEPPHFVITPWLSGQTLARLLARQAPLDLPSVLWIARQMAEALDALHTAGWMHGDVKPSNIFVSDDLHVTLLDLGFARRGRELSAAVDRLVMGTCHYIAPEMITSRLQPDIRSDVYSLGAVLFEALSGRLPFEGNDLAELATQHRQARPPNLRRLVPHLPEAVTRLADEMLAKTPLRRPQTPAELIDRLVALEVETFSQRA